MLVIVEVYKHHSWARLMIAILPWQLAKHLPVLWNLVSSQKRKLSSQITLNPESLVSKMCDVFSNGDLPSVLLGNKGNSNSLYCLRALLIMVPWPTTQKKVSDTRYREVFFKLVYGSWGRRECPESSQRNPLRNQTISPALYRCLKWVRNGYISHSWFWCWESNPSSCAC